MMDFISTLNESISRQPNNLSQNDNPICDGFGCNKKFALKIDVNVGRFGNIILQLCDSCLAKFNNDKTNEVANQNEV